MVALLLGKNSSSSGERIQDFASLCHSSVLFNSLYICCGHVATFVDIRNLLSGYMDSHGTTGEDHLLRKQTYELGFISHQNLRILKGIRRRYRLMWWNFFAF